MAITISNTADTLIRTQKLAQKKTADSLEKLSSGKQVNSAKDDAAGISIINNFNAQSEGFSAAIESANSGIALAQTADSGFSNIESGLQRIRDLALQAGNGALDATQKKVLEDEANAVRTDITQIAATTKFNERSVLGADATLKFQVGAETGETKSLVTVNVDKALKDAGLNKLDFSSETKINEVITATDKGLVFVTDKSVEIGAFQNSVESSIQNLAQRKVDTESSRSRIEDADVAKEVTKLVASQLQDQAAQAVLAQASPNKGIVEKLLSF